MEWLTEIFAERWVLAGTIGYFVGFLTAWMLFGGSSGKKAPRAMADAPQAAADRSPVQSGQKQDQQKTENPGEITSMKLGALEAELRSAKTMLDENAKENEAFSEILDSLDAAVKRANQRLKVVSKSVSRAKAD